MHDFNEAEVKAMADAVGVKVSEADLPLLTIRLNGMIAHLQPLEVLPLDDLEFIPSLLTQRGGA